MNRGRLMGKTQIVLCVFAGIILGEFILGKLLKRMKWNKNTRECFLSSVAIVLVIAMVSTLVLGFL